MGLGDGARPGVKPPSGRGTSPCPPAGLVAGQINAGCRHRETGSRHQPRQAVRSPRTCRRWKRPADAATNRIGRVAAASAQAGSPAQALAGSLDRDAAVSALAGGSGAFDRRGCVATPHESGSLHLMRSFHLDPATVSQHHLPRQRQAQSAPAAHRTSREERLEQAVPALRASCHSHCRSHRPRLPHDSNPPARESSHARRPHGQHCPAAPEGTLQPRLAKADRRQRIPGAGHHQPRRT